MSFKDHRVDMETPQQLLEDLRNKPSRLTYTRDSVLRMVDYILDEIDRQLQETGEIEGSGDE